MHNLETGVQEYETGHTSLQLEDIITFLQVAESGSVSRAAKLLRRPKASVSHNLRRLEQEMGATLFDRAQNAMSLNATGRQFLDHAKAIRVAYENAAETVKSSLVHQAGHIRIASTSEFASNIMSSIFMDFAEDSLGLNIQAMTHPREVLLELRAQYDCIIYLGDPPLPDFAEMRKRRLGEFRYQWFASPDYLERAGHPGRPRDLADHKLLVQLDEHDTPAWRAICRTNSVELRPVPSFSSNDPWIVKLAAVHGRGICFLPTFFARLEMEAGMLAPVLSEWASREVEVNALYWQHRFANPNLALLLERATANFGQIDHYLYRATRPVVD